MCRGVLLPLSSAGKEPPAEAGRQLWGDSASVSCLLAGSSS